jgi:hypothetical protein
LYFSEKDVTSASINSGGKNEKNAGDIGDICVIFEPVVSARGIAPRDVSALSVMSTTAMRRSRKWYCYRAEGAIDLLELHTPNMDTTQRRSTKTCIY